MSTMRPRLGETVVRAAVAYFVAVLGLRFVAQGSC